MKNIAKAADLHKDSRRTGVLKVGGCVLKETKNTQGRDFLSTGRQAEIERILVDRHGHPPLEDCRGTDDVETCRNYLMAVAGSRGDVHGFVRRWMPWWDDEQVLQEALKTVRNLEEVKPRPKVIRADPTAKLLRITFAKRQELGLRTIGACDISKDERDRLAAEAKRAWDREYVTAKRRADGVKSRAETRPMSVAARKPWEEAGMSRATWYRKRRETVRLECRE